jgi:hypothetical protein
VTSVRKDCVECAVEFTDDEAATRCFACRELGQWNPGKCPQCSTGNLKGVHWPNWLRWRFECRDCDAQFPVVAIRHLRFGEEARAWRVIP